MILLRFYTHCEMGWLVCCATVGPLFPPKSNWRQPRAVDVPKTWMTTVNVMMVEYG